MSGKDDYVPPLSAEGVAAMGLALDDVCDIQHVHGMRPHRHITLPVAEEPTGAAGMSDLRAAVEELPGYRDRAGEISTLVHCAALADTLPAEGLCRCSCYGCRAADHAPEQPE